MFFFGSGCRVPVVLFFYLTVYWGWYGGSVSVVRLPSSLSSADPCREMTTVLVAMVTPAR
uniref:Uncharacterized protein n=1 Tax=Arundo donax TaxID=35708 RepID=A0A0A9H0N1_ARUDO